MVNTSQKKELERERGRRWLTLPRIFWWEEQPAEGGFRTSKGGLLLELTARARKGA